MEATLTESEEGKDVTMRDGETLGSVEQVDQGIGYVAVADDASDEALSVLTAEGDDEYTSQEPQVADVTDERVVLDADVT